MLNQISTSQETSAKLSLKIEVNQENGAYTALLWDSIALLAAIAGPMPGLG